MDITSLVRKAENDYTTGKIHLNQYVDFSMHDTLEKIDAYLNSVHTSGKEDSQGRDKPFFNIGVAAANIWYRATDLDRKNLRIKSTKNTYQEWLKSFWATAKLKEWMRREKIGTFLNDWGRTLSRYGSAVPKFVEKGGKLIASIVPWNRLIVDPIQFEGNPTIEVLWMTPADLRKNKLYDQEVVEKLIKSVSSRETLDGQQKDNRADYIKVYEVHGELPVAYLEEDGDDTEEDKNEYRQQMHVVSYVAKKDDPKKFDDFHLFKGREAKHPYMITHLIKEEGRTLAIGAIEHTFEAQWMVNHTAKAIKDHLDLASKLIFQTSDGTFRGRNTLTQIEQGDIMIHKPNEPLTQINNSSHDITALQNFGAQWQQVANEITSTPDAIQGETMPSGTAWRQVEALRTEAHSLFEIMRESKGLYVEDMLREFIIPYLKKELKKEHSIVAELSKEDADKIDQQYINVLMKEQLDTIEGQGGFVDPVQAQQEMQNAKEKLNVTGNRREQNIPKDLFDDFEWETDFEITDESIAKDAVLTTLTTVLQTIAGNPLILQDPNARMIFNRILEETGAISPVEFQNVAQPAVQQPQLPAGQTATQPAQELAAVTGSV